MAARGLRASQIPIGNPITTQNNRAVNTSARVIIACDQAPIAPMAISDISVAIPMPTPETCQAISAKRIIATGAGIPSSSC
ncbi:Uncharacterised protein [Salmonella enterica subsp. enterica serovar Bovismorbificans]|uniref:Uncharacterized protein n=1 Tax=Salmonella enterica subsp. enterica serovar Bovismorbificans TaxID=58097 RepID=A0A655CSB5_SALET|nr:Uncharacterised protein [Salmonella enterica subsp. enterica serovar Bovismorbificans]